jgi:hypothetical protein
MLEYRSKPALCTELMEGRAAARNTTTTSNNTTTNNNTPNNNNANNSDNDNGNNNDDNNDVIVANPALEGGALPVALVDTEAAVDEHELAELAAATATAAIEAAMQDLMLETEAPAPPVHTGESLNSIDINSSTSYIAPTVDTTSSGDAVATSDGRCNGESTLISEVFPGADSDDHDNDDLVVVGERTVLRPGSEGTVGTATLSLASVRDCYDDTTASTYSTSTTAVAESGGAGCSSSSCISSSGSTEYSSSSGTITGTTELVSTSCSTSRNCSSSSSSNSNSSSSSSNELTLSVPTQLHSHLQQTAELCRAVYAACMSKGMSKEHITQHYNTVLLLQAEAEAGDASLASVDAIMTAW